MELNSHPKCAKRRILSYGKSFWEIKLHMLQSLKKLSDFKSWQDKDALIGWNLLMKEGNKIERF